MSRNLLKSAEKIMNHFELDFANSFAFFIKGGIIDSIEQLIRTVKNPIVGMSFEKDGVYYHQKNGNNMFLYGVRYNIAAKSYPEIFKNIDYSSKDFSIIKNQIDSIRKNIDINSLINTDWENIYYFENIDFVLNKNLEENINILKYFIQGRLLNKDLVDSLINSAWTNFINISHLKNYIIPTIEKYDYWKSLHTGNKTFHEAYKDYKND